jgi:hypothetical protein
MANWDGGQVSMLTSGQTLTCTTLSSGQLYGIILYNSAGNDNDATVNVALGNQQLKQVTVPGTTANQGLASVVLVSGNDGQTVAVWVGEAGTSGAPVDQVHEREQGVVRGRNAVLLREGKQVARLLDLPWEAEDPAHWEHAASTPGRVVLAGKLAADNVADAIRRVRPWAVDASSRLEVSPGIKDPAKVRAYVKAARG